MISYKMFIREHDTSLQVPMTPDDRRRTGCHTYTWPTSDWGRAEAKKQAQRYAAYVRRQKYRLGADFDIEDYL